MNRKESLDEIMVLLIVKRAYAALLDEMTKEIDMKAKRVELKPYERTKLILSVDEIMND